LTKDIRLYMSQCNWFVWQREYISLMMIR